MEPNKRNILRSFTILSLAAAVMIGFQYVGQYPYCRILEFLEHNQEVSIYRWLSWLFHSPWTDTLVEYLFLLGITYVPIYFLICRLPKCEKTPRELSGKDLVIGLIMAMGLGYLCNLAGTLINWIVSLISGASIWDMNPVTEMLDEITPSMMLYACIIGPFMEELMCREFLLKRARVFGDWTAVVFTSVVFGLMHGNIAQFLYATTIGLVLGYITVKTNRLRYAVSIHIVINSYNMILASVDTLLFELELELLILALSAVTLIIMVVLIIGGLILAFKYGRIWYQQMKANNGPPSEDKIFVYLNPGFFIYLILCLVEFFHYLM